MESVAEYIGAHALIALLCVAALMLLFTRGLWWVVQRYGPPLLRSVAALWMAAAGSRPALNVRRVRFLYGAFGRTRLLVSYLGLQALISFAVAIAAFAAFFGVADEIEVDADLARFDEALSASLRAHVSRELLQAFALITQLGDSGFLIVLCALVAGVLLWRRRWRLAAAWMTATALGGVLNRVLKALFERARPLHDHGLMNADGWSFPSGHASGSMLVYGLLGYLVVRHTPIAWHVPVALVTVTVIVFVGFSRVLLQVHYFSDVLAGYASAAAWVAMWIAGLEAARRTRPP